MTLQKSPHKAPHADQPCSCVLMPCLMPALTYTWETKLDDVYDGDSIEITCKVTEVGVSFINLKLEALWIRHE